MMSTTDYEDIINLPHYEPKGHPRMSVEARAAQFAPFAALTGYDAVIRESGRFVDSEIELGESWNEYLNQQMEKLTSLLSSDPLVEITYFQPDSHKQGGAYVTVTGRVRKLCEQPQPYLQLAVVADAASASDSPPTLKDIPIHGITNIIIK